MIEQETMTQPQIVQRAKIAGLTAHLNSSMDEFFNQRSDAWSLPFGRAC
jgi:hypothetical protein